MQIITAPVTIANTLRHLACSLVADRASWQNWYILSIAAEPALYGAAQQQLADTVRIFLTGHDGAVLRAEGSPCLAVFYDKHRFDTAGFTVALNDSMALTGAKFTINCLSVTDSAEDVLGLINQYEISETTDEAGTAALDFSKSVHRFDDLFKLWDRSRHASDTRRRPHIMVVDDDACTRSIVNHALRKNYEVIVAENCAEAIRKHILFAPDIVFLDIGLPDHSGLKLLDYIRKNDPRCRVIVFSGNDYLKNRLRAFASGAAGFVSKPFNRQVFERYIDTWRHPINQPAEGCSP